MKLTFVSTARRVRPYRMSYQMPATKEEDAGKWNWCWKHPAYGALQFKCNTPPFMCSQMQRTNMIHASCIENLIYRQLHFKGDRSLHYSIRSWMSSWADINDHRKLMAVPRRHIEPNQWSPVHSCLDKVASLLSLHFLQWHYSVTNIRKHR